MNSSELFSLLRPNTHQVKTLISLIPFRPSARSITWYEESAHIPLLSLLLFPPLFLPLPPSSPSQFFWPRSCAVVCHQIWVFDKGQNDNRKKTTISDCTPGMALVVNLSCGSYSQAKCEDFNATTCLPDVRWTKNVNFEEKRQIKQKWFMNSGWIWDIPKLHMDKS